MKQTILITASSFPLHQQSTKGNFILEFATHLSKYYNIIVLTHQVGDALTEEYFDKIKVKRYRFLPFSFLDKYFAHGVLHAFSSSMLLFLLLAPLYFLCQLLAIRKIVTQHQVKLIHAHWIIPQGLAAILYKKIFNSKIKIISTIHGGDIFAFNGFWGQSLKSLVLKNVNHLTVVSTHIKKELEKYRLQTPVTVLPMGVDTNKFSPEKYKETIKEQYKVGSTFLLFVGRLSEKKGLTYLIAAMPTIVDEFSTIKLLIAGDGPLKESLKEQVDILKLSSNVIFLGNVLHQQLPYFYATADIFIGPSIVAKSGDSEGFGLVFAEAAASGTLVITTNFEAMQDIIQDKKTGLVVQQKSANDIAEKVIFSLKHHSDIQKITVQAKEHVRSQFDWNVISQQYAEIYDSVLIESFTKE